MTLSINCKEAGDPTCTHTISGETEQELFDNAKKHELDQHRKTFGQVEPTPEPAPDNPEEPNGDGEETGNEDPT